MPNEVIPTWQREPGKAGSLAPLRGSKYPMVDAHLHVVNFVQETPGGEALIEAMDRANVAKAVIFGLPVAKLWAEHDREAPDYYLANDARCYHYYLYADVVVADMVRGLPADRQDRLYPLMCGFNPTDKFALREFPRTRFIVAHCGISRRLNVPRYYQMVRRLLDHYPQVVVDDSWIIFDVVICPGGEPQPEWIALTEQYSERICLGSDLMTKFERLGPELQRYDVFLDQLSETARANVCRHTAERVYGGNKGKVR